MPSYVKTPKIEITIKIIIRIITGVFLFSFSYLKNTKVLINEITLEENALNAFNVKYCNPKNIFAKICINKN